MRFRPFRFLLAGSIAVLCAACAGIGTTEKRPEGDAAPTAALAERLDAHEARMAALARDMERASRRVDAAESRSQEARTVAAEALGLATQARTAAGESRVEAIRVASAARAAGGRLSQHLAARGRYAIVESRSVAFDFGGATPDDGAMTALADIARRLRDNPALVVEVEGHSDSVGDAQANVRLSRERADAVARHLVRRHGIALHRIHILGLGAAAPLSDNNSREGRARNRRVEIRVLSPEG
jgi:outer membrane protein OmpA-like peptidoglycan-associated protein